MSQTTLCSRSKNQVKTFMTRHKPLYVEVNEKVFKKNISRRWLKNNFSYVIFTDCE